MRTFLSNCIVRGIDGGVDPRSPQGTAAAFTKPTLEALERANTSHLYEMASEELFR